LFDLDGDGKTELFTFSPFHGSTLKIYKELNGVYSEAYRNKGGTEFLHAICSGVICGTPAVVIGHRSSRRQILLFSFDKNTGEYRFEVVDDNCGSANLLIYHWKGYDRIISANRETDEVAIYTVTCESQAFLRG
jgi:hypothetical protein